MRAIRTLSIALAAIATLGASMAVADTDDDDANAARGYPGHMGMMGPGYGPMMGYGPTGMPGYGYGPMGHVPGRMMGPGHGFMMHGPGHMMGHGHMMGYRHGQMPRYGHGAMMWRGKSGMRGNAGFDPDQLGDEALDRMAEHMAERHRTMQEIAAEQDPEARRELVRKHLQSMQSGMAGLIGGNNGDDADRRGYRPGGMMGQGMMGQGMMGQGMMGRAPSGMMSTPAFSDEQLDELGARMAENFRRMQQLAETTDKAERRQLLREHFESMHQRR